MTDSKRKRITKFFGVPVILVSVVFIWSLLISGDLFAQIKYNEKSAAAPKGNSSEIVRVVSVTPMLSDALSATGFRKRYLILVRSGQERQNASPIFENAEGKEIFVSPKNQDIIPNRWSIFYAAVVDSKGPASNTASKLTQKTDSVSSIKTAGSSTVVSAQPPIKIRMNWQKNDESVELPKSKLYDLTSLKWESLFRGEKDLPNETELPRDFFDKKSQWKPLALPKLWNELGITWIRTSFEVPDYWCGRDFVLLFPAIDDNDVTYFNGHRIGKTIGWDLKRRYVVPAAFIKFGGKNELLIAEQNQNAGGGVVDFNFWFGLKEEEPEFNMETTGLFPEDVIRHESDRRPNRSKGTPLPLRPFTVRDGVLEYENGGEVALWGTNYYPQSWMQYVSIKDRGFDHRKAVDLDLEDMAPKKTAGSDGSDPRRMNMIRIHVFDTEISDSKGNLVKNDHLDILDYLTARCSDHGIYLWLTPIAWWGSPCSRSDAFSQQIPMPAMTLLPETRPVQINYLKQFLTHRNPYTNRRLIDEPCLALFEILNETLYWDYSHIIELNKPFRNRKDTLDWIRKVRGEWEKSLPDPSWKSVQTWDFYCYQQVRNYIDEMRNAIRSVGGRQPVSYHGSSWSSKTPVYWAIADSQCEGITLNFYSGLSQKPVSDKKSHLLETISFGLPRQLDKKVRLVYEFDASDTLYQIDLYPAIARHWRELGVQAACQFQYDSRVTADRNQDWPTHYLNLIHAPHRFASFMIAGETFRSLPRGVKIEPNKNELIFPPTAVNWKENAAFLVKKDLFMQARPSNWKPFEFPQTPRRILGTGSTPYYQYEGTGLVDLDLDGSLSLGPNVTRHRDDLRGTAEKPLTTLSMEKKPFLLQIPGYEKIKYKDSQGNILNGKDGLSPGEYKLIREEK